MAIYKASKFQEWAKRRGSVRVVNAIERYDIRVSTTYAQLLRLGGVGYRTARGIQNLQRAYKINHYKGR